MDREEFFRFFEAFAARKLGLSASANLSHRALEPPQTATLGMDPKQRTEAERRHQVYLMLRHLDARRDQLEADILKALLGQKSSGHGPLSRLREQLEEVQSLRRSYEAELVLSEKGADTPLPRSVFVSSTSTDLKEHRQAVRSVIKRLQLKFIGMEELHHRSSACRSHSAKSQ